MAKKNPFDRPYTKAASAGSNDVETNPVEPGRLYCYQRIVVENETNSVTDVRILKKSVGQEIVVAEKDTLSAATVFVVDEPIYITEGQKLVARFTGCSANDVLKMYAMGYWQVKREVQP